MNLIISGHQLEVTPALREYVVNKLDRPLRHFDERPTSVSIVLSADNKGKKRRQTAQITVHFNRKEIALESSAKDLYAAIDDLMGKLNRQVSRHKDRTEPARRGYSNTYQSGLRQWFKVEGFAAAAQ